MKNNKNELSKEVQEIKSNLSEYKEEINFSEPIIETPEQPVKKETRGRKPGSKNKRAELLEPAAQPTPGTLQASDIISGALLLMFIDLAIPNLLVFANNARSKKKIKAKALQMTDEQKRQLEPFANEASKQLLLKGNPVQVFLIALISIYGLNFIALKNA